MHTDRERAESNMGVVHRVDAALARGDMDEVSSLFHPDAILELAENHPVGGIFQGLANVNAARARMKAVLGITAFRQTGMVADGSPLVVVMLDVSGVDAKGKAWTMPVMESVRIIDGRITELRIFFQDTVRLRQIAGERG